MSKKSAEKPESPAVDGRVRADEIEEPVEESESPLPEETEAPETAEAAESTEPEPEIISPPALAEIAPSALVAHWPELRTGDVVLFGDEKEWTDVGLVVDGNVWRIEPGASSPTVPVTISETRVAVRHLTSPPITQHGLARLQTLVEFGKLDSAVELVEAAYFVLGLLGQPPEGQRLELKDFAPGGRLPFIAGVSLGGEIKVKG